MKFLFSAIVGLLMQAAMRVLFDGTSAEGFIAFFLGVILAELACLSGEKRA